jgi:hypothetical protein
VGVEKTDTELGRIFEKLEVGCCEISGGMCTIIRDNKRGNS